MGKRVIVLFEDVFLSYTSEARRIMILRGLTFKLHERETLLISGPSGSGKTSILRLILGLLKPDAGTIRVFGLEPSDPSNSARIRRDIGYLTQEGLLIPQLTIRENIEFYLHGRGRLSREALARVEELAEKLDIKAVLDKYPKNVSGGEARRAELLLALSDSPKLLLLDEPTAMLDPESAELVIKVLSEEKRHRAIVIATHDPRLNPISDKILNLLPSYRGRHPRLGYEGAGHA